MLPARYRALFALPGFARLLTSALAGRLPVGMSSLAILLLTRSATHSFAVAGVASGAFAVCEAAAAPVTGVLINRLGARLLIPSAIVQAGFLVALVLVAHVRAPAAVLVVMAAGVGASMPPVSACSRMLWARVTPDRTLRESAFALDATAQEIVWTTGPLVVGVLAAAVSPAAAVLAVAVVTLSGTVLFATAPAARLLAGDRLAADGRTRVLRHRPLQILLFAGVLIGVGLGTIEVALPALAIRHHSHTASGLLLSVWSIGSMIGGIAYGARHWRGGQVRRLGLLLMGAALAQALLMGAFSLALAFPLAAVSGLCIAPSFSCLFSLLGEHTPADGMAAAFTWNTAALVGGVAGGSALAGTVVSHVGLGAAFGIASIFTLLSAGVVIACERWLVEDEAGRRAVTPVTRV